MSLFKGMLPVTCTLQLGPPAEVSTLPGVLPAVDKAFCTWEVREHLHSDYNKWLWQVVCVGQCIIASILF